MKIHSKVLMLCCFHAHVWGTTAFTFTVKAPMSPSAIVLKASTPPAPEQPDPPVPPVPAPVGDLDMFPAGTFPMFETVQGGGTVKTFKMPQWAERVQYTLRTNGRPLKAKVQLWVGPIRQVHNMEIDMEDGNQTPFQATIKFKKAAPTLRVITSDCLELPVQAAVSVPSPERSDELMSNTERVWENATPEQKQLIQGGSTTGGPGAVRYYQIPDNVNCVQVVAWSKDTSKKSLRCNIEVLQGPNNKKQSYTLQCGGGSQPYHAVMQTPGQGNMIRITNLKFVEDGLFQFAVVPYDVAGDANALVSSPFGSATPGRPWYAA